MPTEKRSFNLRISPEALRLIAALATKLGVSKAAVFEMAIRKLAKEEGVE